MQRTRWFFPAIWGAFFVSGAAGLIYEVVWARYLDLILGGTAYAHVMVLAAYMGGLALGAWFFGRLADRLLDPLAVYTYLEMAVGLYGILFPVLFTVWSSVYLTLAGPLGTTGMGGVFNKLLVSTLLIVPSTFMMGGTLPLLARTVTALPQGVGRSVAGLYFINSIGAVSGALLAGFVFIPALGVSTSLLTAAALNILVGIGLLAAWRYGVLARSEEATGEAGATGREKAEPAGGEEGEAVVSGEVPDALEFRGVEARTLNRWAQLAVWGAGLSGMVVMIYEVSWIRMLSTILGSSTYSFTLMLAAFITGIALGSWIARWLARFERPFLFFGISQLLVGASLLLALPLYAGLPVTFLGLQNVVSSTDSGYSLYELLKYLYCLAVMLPPTLASGAALPLATDVAARLSRKVGQPVGRVFAVNTAGTIIGALLGGLILLPWLGVKLTLEVGIVINITFGLWVLAKNPVVKDSHLRLLVPGCAAGFILYIMFFAAWDLRTFALGVFRERDLQGSVKEEFQRRVDAMDLVFYEEDVNGTVAVLRGGDDYSLIVNGKADASTNINDRLTQTMIAALPSMMVPDAKTALIVGLGSGQTAGHLLHYPLDRVEVVEISSGVVKASHYFDHMNGRPLDDPRTRLVMQDAKTYLLTRPDARYDLILSEPSNPWIAGIGGLFTREYFTTLKDRLETGGVVAQWIHAYEQNNETLGCVFLTFGQVFPHVTLWGMSPSDLLLVGSTEPINWDFDSAEAALLRPEVAGDLENIFVRDLYTLLNQQLMSPLRMAEATSLGGRLNTDDYPYLEYRAPRAFFMDVEADIHARFDERNRTVRNTWLAVEDYLDGRAPTSAEFANIFYFLDNAGGVLPHFPSSAAAAWFESEPDNPGAVKAGVESGIVALRAAAEKAAGLVAGNPESQEYRETYALTLLTVYDRSRSSLYAAEDIAADLRELLPLTAPEAGRNQLYLMYRLAQVQYDQGAYSDAMDTLNEVLDLIRSGSAVRDQRVQPDLMLSNLGRVLMKLDRNEEAQIVFMDAYRINPNNSVAAFYAIELNPQTATGRYLSFSELARFR